MAYTPLIYLSPDREAALRSYIREELDNHDMERGKWVEELEKWYKMYWATPTPNSGTGPLQGGANIIVPLIAIAVEMLLAKFMTKLFALEQFSAIKLPDEWDDIDSNLTRIIDHELITTANIRHALEEAALDYLIYGTCVLKNGYIERKKKAIIYDLDDTELETEIMVRKGLCIDAVQLQNFLMPFYAKNPQASPWCGEEHTFTPFEIMNMSNAGLFYKDTFENLQQFFFAATTSNISPSANWLDKQELREKRDPIWPKRVYVKEIWCSFDVDNDGEEEEIYLYYHRDSDKLLGIRYNDRHDLSRPYFTKAMFPVAGRWAGIGQAKIGEQFQLEVTTQHRQRIDAISLAILRMFKAKRGTGISPDEPVYMGKIWLVDSMDDLDIIQSGEIYPSSFQGEQAAMLLWQQRSTANEGNLGMPQVGTPGTASSDLGRVQEGNMRFDYFYGRFKDVITETCLDSICIIGKHGVQHEAIYSQYKNGDRIREFLASSPSLLKQQIIIDYKLAGQSQNKLLDRATWTQLAGVMTQAFTNFMQIAQSLGDPNLSQVIARRALTAGNEALRQIYEAFDVRNIDKLALSPEEINGGQTTAPAGALPGIANILPQPGMGLVNPINTTVGGGG